MSSCQSDLCLLLQCQEGTEAADRDLTDMQRGAVGLHHEWGMSKITWLMLHLETHLDGLDLHSMESCRQRRC